MGADVQSANKFGATPLQVCQREHNREWVAVAAFLAETAGTTGGHEDRPVQ